MKSEAELQAALEQIERQRVATEALEGVFTEE